MAESSIESDLGGLLAVVRSALHPRAQEIIEELLRVRELKVAAEHLCEFLCEDETTLPPGPHSELLRLISQLGLDSRFKLIVPPPAEA